MARTYETLSSAKAILQAVEAKINQELKHIKACFGLGFFSCEKEMAELMQIWGLPIFLKANLPLSFANLKVVS